jgi:CRP/FNR family transcriptional regulator, cyclic AMP receptor protein
VDPIAQLARSPLFSGIAYADLEPLARSLRVRHYGRGSYLFNEGDPGSALFILVAGQVKISRIGRGGDEVVFAVLVPGDVFGELAMFDERGERTADAQATEPSECVTIERNALLDFLSSRPALMRHLLSILSSYIRRKDDAFAEVAFLDIPGRVAHKLLELADTRGQPTPDGVRIGIRLSQRTLAGMVAASRENVNRALSRLVAEGAIRQENGWVTILRPELLRRRT